MPFSRLFEPAGSVYLTDDSYPPASSTDLEKDTRRMNFVQDPAVTRALGSSLVSVLEGAVFPQGQCSACGRELGNGTLRFSLNELQLGAMVTTIHASCGTPNLQRGALLGMPNGTWNSVGIMLPRIEERTRRTWWGRTVITESETLVPCMVISPTCDVFWLSRNTDGSFLTPVAKLLEEGFKRYTPETLFTGPTPHIVTAELDSGKFSTTIAADTFFMEDLPGFAQSIQKAGGVLLIVSHEPLGPLFFDFTLTPAERMQMMTSPHTAFAWISDHAIAGLQR